MKLSSEVIAVLDQAKCEGNNLYLAGSPAHLPGTPRLDPKLYQAVNKAIVALGGKWKGGKTQAHVFEEDPAGAISDAILAGSIEDRKKAMGFFETPAALASRLVEMADIRPLDKVLEPSAGRGAIGIQCRQAGPECELILLELDVRHGPTLNGIGSNDVILADFLSRNDLAGKFDRVIANPPFARQQDIDHVLHMHRCLKPGGLLVSVMSSAPMWRDNKKSVEFREFVAKQGGEFEKLPGGSFKESGTMVETCIVKIPKAA
jgi:predicted RNA methylase